MYKIIDCKAKYIEVKNMFNLFFSFFPFFIIATQALRVLDMQSNVTRKKRNQQRKNTFVTNERQKNSTKNYCCYFENK